MDFSISPYAPGREMPLFGTTDLMSEEERKRRELQAKMDQQARLMAMSDEAVASGGFAPVEPTPIKETRTIDPVTGETKIKIEGSERDLSLANPLTPTLSTARAPVAPFNQQQYNASIGAQESGNRPNIGFHDRNKSTAFGQYGITQGAYQDARRLNPNLPQDITQATPEQQNQAMNSFTQQNAKYLQGYGIEPNQNNLAAAHFLGAKGLSDYLKTGYISPQAAAANGGEENVRRIVNQRLGGQAAAASGATQMPTAMPGPGVAVATGQGVQGTMTTPQGPVNPAQPLPANQGIKIPGLMPTNQMNQQPVAQPTQSPLQMGIERFQANQDNLDELVKMRNDQSIPEYLRKRSADRAYELMNSQYKQSQAQSKLDSMVQNGDQMGIAKALSSKPRDEEGSWLKMLALGFISPELAGAEAVKLGLAPTKWSQATYTDKEGNQVAVEIKKRSDGKILAGSKMDGTPLTAEELNLATNSLGSKLNLVGGTYVNDKTGEVGRVISDEKTGRTYVQTDKGPRPLDGFRPQSSTGTAADQRARLIQEMNIKLQGKAGEEAMAIQRDYNKLLVGQGLAPMQPGETPISAPQIASGQSAVAGTATPAVASPVSPEASAAKVPRPTAVELGARKDIVTDAAKQVAASADTQNMLNSINKVTGLLDSGEHNVGSALSGVAGRGPIAQAIGSQFETVDAKNTKTIMDTVQKLAADGLKTLGSNPSTVDLEFWTKYKPDASSDPQFVKEWIESRSEDLKRRLGYASSQVSAGGGAGVAPAANTQLSPQERAKQELARRKKKD